MGDCFPYNCSETQFYELCSIRLSIHFDVGDGLSITLVKGNTRDLDFTSCSSHRGSRDMVQSESV